MPQAAQQTAGTPIESVAGGISDPFQRSLIGKIEADEKKQDAFVDKKIQQIDDTKPPKPPTLTPAPQEKDYQTDPMQTFGSSAMFLALFGSLMTRHPLTAALNSAAAVNNAVAQKDAASFSKAFDKWKIDTENAWKMADWDQKIYKNAIDKGDTEIKEYVTAHKSRAAEMALEARMTEQNYKHLEAMNKKAQSSTGAIFEYVQTGLEEENAKREAEGKPPMTEMEEAQKKLELFGQAKNSAAGKGDNSKPTWSESAIEKAADAVAGGVRLSVAVPGVGKNNPNRDAVMNKLAEKYPDVNLADIDAGYAGRTSEARAVGTASGKLKLSANLLDKAIPLAREAVGKVDLSEYSNVNELENAVRKRTGDKTLAAAYTALQTVMSDYSALIARNGTSTDSTRAAARDLVNENMSKGQLNAVFDQMEKEKSNVLEAVQETKGGGQGGDKRIKVTDPDGTPQTIDASELDEALSHGWKKR